MMKKLFTLLLILSSINGFEIKIDKSRKFSNFYRDNSKQVVIDTKRGLMWQDDKSVTTTLLSWQDAIRYCKNLTFAGYSDWRLPNEDELLSITDDSRSYPAIKKEFKYVNSSGYWSSTPHVSLAWYVGFSLGNGDDSYKTGKVYVRCVRDSK
jgi:hypothetical protein